MADLIQIAIKAILDPTSESAFIASINNIRTKINSAPFKIKVETDSSALNVLATKLQEVSANANKAIKLNVDTLGVDKIVQKFTAINGQAAELTRKTTEFSNGLGIGVRQVESFKIGLDSAGQSESKLISKTQEYTNGLKVARVEAEKLANTVRNAYSAQTFNNFNSRVGIGTTSSNSARESAGVFQAQQQASDTARRMIVDQENQRVAVTTNAQRRIEQMVLRSNETIAQQQARMNSSQANGTRYEQMFLQATRERATLDERNLTTERLQTAELQRQIALFQERNALAIRNLQAQYPRSAITPAVQQSLGAIQTSASGLNTSATTLQNLRTQTTAINTALSTVRTGLNETVSASNTLGNDMAKNVGKMLIWSIAATAIYFPLRMMQSAVKYVNELDNALNEIRIVTNLSQPEVDKLAKSYNALGKAMSVSTKDIASTSVDLYRQGLSGTDVEDRMSAIIKYAKISSLSMADSNKIITATMNATGESAQKVIDTFSYLGDATASGADEIGVAMQKVASMNDGIGVSMQKAASWVAVISSKTREGASQIGTSLKSIESRYSSIKSRGFNDEDATNINDVTKALTKAGIQAVTSDGQLRNFAEVIDELGSRYGTLDAKTQNYLMTTLGGTYQMNRLRALMDGYSQSVDLYNESLSKSGIANEKFNIWQESTGAKLEKLKSTFQGFYSSIADSNTIKELIDSLTYLISTFGNLTTIITVVALALGVFKGVAILNFFKGLSLYTNLANISFIQARASLEGLSFAQIGAMTTTQGLGFAIRGLWSAMLANPIGLIVTAITAVVMAFDMYKQKQQENAQMAEQASQKLNEEQDALKRLAEEYKNIVATGNSTAESKARLKGIQDQLIKTYGIEAKELDLVNGKYVDQIALVNKLVSDKAKEQLTSMGTSGEDALAKSEKVSSTQVSSGSSRNKKEVESILTSVVGDSVGLNNENRQLFEINGTLKERVSILERLKLELDGVANKDKFTKDLINDVSSEYNKLNTEMKDNQSILDKYVQNKNVVDFYDEFKSSLSGVSDLMAKSAKNPSDTSVSNQLSNLESEMRKLADSKGRLGDFAPFIDELFGGVPDKAKTATDNTNSFALSVTNLQKTLESSSENITEVQSALDEYNKEGSFSLDNLIKLSEKHKQLIPILGDEKKVRQELTNIIQEEQEKSKQAYITMLEGSVEFYNKNIEGIQAMVKGLDGARNADLSGAKTLAEAKLQVELALIKNLASLWSDYYDAQSGAFTGEFENVAGKKVVSGGINGESTAVSDAMVTQLQSYTQQANKAKEEFDKIALKGTSGIDFSKIGMSKSGDSKDKKDKEAQSIQSLTDALLAQIKVESDLQKAKSEAIKEEIDQAKSSKDYQKSLEKTNELIASQAKEFELLNTARSRVNVLKDSALSSSKFGDTSRWFTGDDNSESTAFVSEKNKASEDTRKLMDEEFKSMQALRNGWTSYTKEIKDNIEAQTQLKSSLQDINFSIVTQQIEPYDKSIQSLTDSLSTLKAESEQYDKSSSQYSDNQKQQIDLSKQKSSAIQDEIDQLLILISATDLTADAQDELNDKIKGQQSLLLESKNQTLATYNSLADGVIATIKRAYEKQKDIAIAEIEDEINAETKRHEKKLENLDKEMDKYQDAYDAKLKLIDDEANAEDYANSLAVAQKEKQDTQNKINVLSIDNSAEGQFKKSELEKRLLEQTTAIEKTQKDHERELRKESLSEQLDNYKEDIDSQKESEDAKTKSRTDALNKQKTDTEYMYNELINDEKKYANIRLQIINGNVAGIKNTMDGFLTSFGKMNKATSESIGESWVDLLSTIQEVKSASESVKDVKSAKESSSSSSSGTTAKINVYGVAQDISNAKSYAGSSKFNYIEVPMSGSASQAKLGDIVLGGTGVISSAGKADRVYGNTAEDTLAEFKKKIAKYKTGGETSTTGFHWLDGKVGKPERILSPEQTESFNKLVVFLPKLNVMDNILKNFKIPDFANMKLPQFNTSVAGGSTYNLNLNIESLNGDVNGGKTVFNEIIKGLKKMGVK